MSIKLAVFFALVVPGCGTSDSGHEDSCAPYPADCSLTTQSDFQSVITTPLKPVVAGEAMGIQIYACRADAETVGNPSADVKIHCYGDAMSAFEDGKTAFQTQTGYQHLDGLGQDAFWIATLEIAGQATGTIEVLTDSRTIVFVDTKAFPDVASAFEAAKRLATLVVGRL